MKTQTKIQVLQENMDQKKILKVFDRFAQSYHSFQRVHSVLPPPPPGIGGEWFLCCQPGKGETAKLKEPGWGHIQVGDDFRQSSRGGTAFSWWIVGISTKCFTLNFTNFACGAILYFWTTLEHYYFYYVYVTVFDI